MIFVRRTKPCDADRDRAIRSSSSRSPSVSEIARSCGRPMRAVMIRPKAQERIMNPFANYVNLFVGHNTRQAWRCSHGHDAACGRVVFRRLQRSGFF